MSPSRKAVLSPFKGFPRVSGDEPDTVALVAADLMFSPRERG